MVALNRAVAVSMAEGPAAGLALLDELDGPALAGYQHLPAARGDCLRRLGRWPEAAAAYRRALGLTEPPRAGLLRRSRGGVRANRYFVRPASRRFRAAVV